MGRLVGRERGRQSGDCETVVLGRVRESDNLLRDMIGRLGLRQEIERLVGNESDKYLGESCRRERRQCDHSGRRTGML